MTLSKKISFILFNIVNITMNIAQIYFIIQALQYFGLNNYLSSILAFVLICFNSFFLTKLTNTPLTATLKVICGLANIALVFIGAYYAAHLHILLAIILAAWSMIANTLIFFLTRNNHTQA